MKKVYKMENLDCANCAAKMERNIAKIDGVENVNVNFIGQKLTIEADENRLEAIMDEAIKVCKKIEPDCKIIR